MTDKELAEELRAHGMVQPRGSMVRTLMLAAADVLMAREALGWSDVEPWLAEREIKLLPWQKTRAQNKGGV